MMRLSSSALLKIAAFGLLLACAARASAQFTGNPAFEQFADAQSDRLMAAYENRDTKSYQELLGAFLAKYRQLKPDEQKRYAYYYTNAYYNLACTYSLLNEKSPALENLEKAIKGGYFDYAHMMVDSDLDNIRREARFVELVQPLREIGDYGYILKKAGAYNLADQRPLPEFTYQPADNPNLLALRKGFNLDSIAGTGNEVSRILNLLHWVHNLIPHDGNHGNPEVKNAMNMIAVCKQENRGLNCRGLATVLNECYLALGFKSRFVTCLPKDSLKVDPDCHVINAVYSNTLNKWLWIDPTNDAYVMNEQGELLSIEEVRERIINGKPLILNPDANWNRRESTTKEDYLYRYMAKNLYLLQCNVNSEYDTETHMNGKTITTITLCPLDYYDQKPDRKEVLNKESNTTFVHYKTNNPAAFWKAP